MVYISAIILAAGESKRMGQPKLLLKWKSGTILEQTINNYLKSAVKETIVVLGHKADELKHVIGERQVITVLNPFYTSGMSTSIITGLSFARAGAQGIMIALADQPSINSETIDKLILYFNMKRKGIVLPSYRGKRGHPVIFDTKYRKELTELKGDAGAREIINHHPEDVLEVPVEDEGIKLDIDTPDNYKSYKSQLQKDSD